MAARSRAGADVRAHRARRARPRGGVRGRRRRVRARPVADGGLVHHVVPGDRGPGRGGRPHRARVPVGRAQGGQGGPRPGTGQRGLLRGPALPGRRRVRRARAAGALQLPGTLRRRHPRGLAARRRHRATGREARSEDAAAARPGVQRHRRTRADGRVRAGHQHLVAGRHVHRRGRRHHRRVLPARPDRAGRARHGRPLPQRLRRRRPHAGRRGRPRRPGAARRPAADATAGGSVLPFGLRRRLGRQLRRAADPDARRRGGRRPARGGGRPAARALSEPGRPLRRPRRRARGLGAGERRHGAVPHARSSGDQRRRAARPGRT